MPREIAPEYLLQIIAEQTIEIRMLRDELGVSQQKLATSEKELAELQKER